MTDMVEIGRAIANAVGSTAVGLAASGNKVAATVILTNFENLNAATVGPELAAAIADGLTMSKAVLSQMP